jgi:hypothetical protein
MSFGNGGLEVAGGLEKLSWKPLIFRKSLSPSWQTVALRGCFASQMAVRCPKGQFHAEMLLSMLKIFRMADTGASSRQPARWKDGKMERCLPRSTGDSFGNRSTDGTSGFTVSCLIALKMSWDLSVPQSRRDHESHPVFQQDMDQRGSSMEI